MKCKDLFRIVKILTALMTIASIVLVTIATFQKFNGIEPSKVLMDIGTIFVPLTALLFVFMLVLIIIEAKTESKNDKRNSRS